MSILSDVRIVDSKNRSHGAKELYGRQRLWSSLAEIACGALISGLAKAMHERYGKFIYLLAAATHVVAFSYALLTFPADRPNIKSKDEQKNVECGKPSAKKPAGEEKNAKPQTSKLRQLKMLFTNRRFMFFLVIALINGISRSIGTLYMSKYMRCKKDGVGLDPVEANIAKTLGQVVEILIYFFNRQLFQACGLNRLIIVSQVTMTARMGMHAFIPKGADAGTQTRALAFIAETMKGISIGLMTFSGVMVRKDRPLIHPMLTFS